MKITRKNIIKVKKFQGKLYNKTKKRNKIIHAHTIQKQFDKQYNLDVRLWVNGVLCRRRRINYSKMGKNTIGMLNKNKKVVDKCFKMVYYNSIQ